MCVCACRKRIVAPTPNFFVADWELISQRVIPWAGVRAFVFSSVLAFILCIMLLFIGSVVSVCVKAMAVFCL